MSFEDHSAIHQILQRLDALEAQVAYLSQALGTPAQAGFGAQPAPIGGAMPQAPGAPAALDPRYQQVVALAQSGKKIHAIKLYRQLTNCSLKTAKDFVDQF